MASSLEMNKLAAGVLTAGIIAAGAAVFSGLLYYPRSLDQHAFPIDVGDDEVDVADVEVADEPSIAVLLASADPAAGQTITRQCTACHGFDEGGANRVGPALWGVVGREVGGVAGFSYSAALQALEGEWTYANLDAYLTSPRDWAPGTSMSYAGLRNAQDRANLIAYLREQSSDPVPLPEPAAEATEAAPVEEEVAEVAPPAAAEETETLTAVPEVDEERLVEAPEAVQVPAAAAEVVEEMPTADAEIPAVTETEPAEEAVAAAEEVVEDVSAAAETAAVAAAEGASEAVEVVDETVAGLAEGAADVATEVVEEAEELVETVTAEATNGAELSGMVAMVAAADPAAGQRPFRQCAACHTVDQGGQNRVGPNLWGVFGADVGHHEGFNYSAALLSIEGIWTVEKLNAYLENPRGFAPGNRMAFAGLRDEADRAAVIAYLRSLSEDPKPVDLQ